MSVTIAQHGFVPLDVAVGEFVYLTQRETTLVLEQASARQLGEYLLEHIPDREAAGR